jgi:putative ABC transport system permease protein
MRAWRRLQTLLESRELDREFEEEARTHIDLAAGDYIQRGIPEAEARRLARLKFGAIEASKDAHRDSRSFAWLDGFLCDLRYSVRGLAHDRGFALTVIVMLALAIGLNVTAFRVMETMLFRGYPLVEHNEQLLYITERYPTPGCCVSYVDFDVWREQARSFQGMAFMVPKSVSLGEGNGDARDLWPWVITSNTFGLLGVRPVLGRDFTPRDEAPGAAPVVIVSHRYWQTRLGGRGDVIGRTVRIDKAPASIIGVLPDGFDFLASSRDDIFLPLEQTADLHLRVANGGLVIGRLANGASENAARVELETINRRLALEYPATNRDVRPEVRNYTEFIAGPDGVLIYRAVWAGASFVLLIACANLANLTLARTQGRVRELCTRMAIGAGRARVIRQLLLESLLLAAVAGLLAWLTADWSTLAWAAATDSFLDYSAGAGTVGYLIGVTLGAAILVTLAPIARLWRLDVNGALKGESRGATINRRARQFSAWLVAGQTALAIVLMAGAGVMGHSLWKVLQADIGVKEPERIFVGQLDLPRERYATPESRLAFFESLRTRLSASPGVQSASVSNGRPTDDFEPLPFEVESQTGALHGTPVFAATPGYFRTLGATVIAGRDFNNADRPGTPLAIIVNRRFAETYFPAQNPVGRRIRVYVKRKVGAGPWRTVVGVVSNVMQNELTRQHFLPAAWIPFEQEPASSAWVFARVPGGSEGIASQFRDEVRQIDPHLEFADFTTLYASLNFQSPLKTGGYVKLARHAAIAPIYAGIALLLAAIGLYSVVSRSADQRTREIGVRMALGSTSREIRRMMLWEAMAPVAVGLLLGLAASLGVNRILEAQLVGVSPYDALTLVLAPVMLVSVAFAGSMLPVRRASLVDPAVTLRHQ